MIPAYNPGKFWLVVNISIHEMEMMNGAKLPNNRRPKHLHETQEAAEKEALRLHLQFGKSGARSFVVFEAVTHTVSRLHEKDGHITHHAVMEPVEPPVMTIAEKPRKRRKA